MREEEEEQGEFFFGACSVNQCAQDQILDILAVCLCLIVLLGLFLKLAFELERVNSK